MNAQEYLDDLYNMGEALGVRFNLDLSYRHVSGECYFSAFYRPAVAWGNNIKSDYDKHNDSGRGHGAIVLNAICELADCEGFTMKLWCYNHMQRYYSRFSFVVDANNHYPAELCDMIRKPSTRH